MTQYAEVELRFLSALPIENGTDVSADSRNPQDWVRYIRTTDIASLTKLAPDKRVTVPDDVAKLAEVQRDDILMTRAGSIGTTYIHDSDEPGCFAGYLVRWRVDRRRAVPRYMAYWTQSKHFIDQVAIGVVRSTIDNYSASKYRGTRAPVPDIDEQWRIADFLDRETTQIDILIAKQQQLIETLRERRGAVLGAEFEALGAKRVQLRRGIRFVTSGSRGWGDYYAEEGDRFLRIGNLPRTHLSLRGEIQYVQLPPGVAEGSRTRLRCDDLLFSITAYLGSVAVVTDQWVGAYVSQHVALCRLDPSMFDSRFVGYFMLTTEGQDQLKLGAAGGTKVQLALDDIKELGVPLVPLDAQRKIVQSVEVRLSRIDALIAKAEEFIGLARERRAALITAAVTGRLDVSTGTVQEGA